MCFEHVMDDNPNSEREHWEIHTVVSNQTFRNTSEQQYQILESTDDSGMEEYHHVGVVLRVAPDWVPARTVQLTRLRRRCCSRTASSRATRLAGHSPRVQTDREGQSEQVRGIYPRKRTRPMQ